MTRFSLLLLAGAGLTLGACAECPRADNDYSKPPYVMEGTAGNGVAVYDSRCHAEARRDMTTTTQRYEPAPQPERTFSESQRK